MSDYGNEDPMPDWWTRRSARTHSEALAGLVDLCDRAEAFGDGPGHYEVATFIYAIRQAAAVVSSSSVTPPDGWFSMGSHVDQASWLALEFSDALDDCGLPLWERPVPSPATPVPWEVDPDRPGFVRPPSPATPARHPGDEGNPAIDALKASSARIAPAPPATPEGGRDEVAEIRAMEAQYGLPDGCGVAGIERHLRGQVAVVKDAYEWTERHAAPSPASPAETREVRAALDDARLEVLAVEMRETASHAEASGQPVGPGELRAFARIIDKVRAASPAVSLPGEQPGGQER